MNEPTNPQVTPTTPLNPSAPPAAKPIEDEKEKEVIFDVPSLWDVTSSIAHGNFDGLFDKIEQAMQSRRKARQELVLKQVREVFGEHATVQTSDKLTPDNPFVRRAQDFPMEKLPRIVGQMDDAPTPDPLEDSSMNEVESQMIAEVPIESRGAVISGLSSSDIDGK